MTSTLPEDAGTAGAAAAALLGDDVVDVEAIPSFAGNRVFRAQTTGGRLILKFGPPDAIALEHAVLQVVSEQQVPVPPVVAADPDGGATGHACLIMRVVGGQPLSGSEAAFDAAGPLLERVHALGCDGFGTLVVTPDGSLRGEDESWLATLRHRVHSAAPVVDAGLVPGSLVSAVAAAVEQSEVSEAEPRLLHGDFHPRHVYAEATQVTAIIDWGDATSGDPDYDIARVVHAVMLTSDLPTAIATAQRVLPRGLPLTAERTKKLLAYAAVFVLWSMRGEYDAGAPWPPWWPLQTRALERILKARVET